MKIKINNTVIEFKSVAELEMNAREQVETLNLKFGGGFTFEMALQSSYKIYYEQLIKDLSRAVGPIPIPEAKGIAIA